jgi:hypothetical protein
MCIARISRAIRDTETELQAAAARVADESPDGTLSLTLQKVLEDRIHAFGELHDALERIRKTFYAETDPPTVEDVSFPPRS